MVVQGSAKVLSKLTLMCSLGQEVHVEIGRGEPSAETALTRREFLMSWIERVSINLSLLSQCTHILNMVTGGLRRSTIKATLPALSDRSDY